MAEAEAHLLWVHVVQVVLHELDRSCEVGLVELVRDVPANRSKLAALLHRRVEEGDGVQHGLPLLHVAHLELVLQESQRSELKVSFRTCIILATSYLISHTEASVLTFCANSAKTNACEEAKSHLSDEAVGSLEPRLDALRRLGRVLDGALQQVDRELGMRLRRDPAAERVVHLLLSCDLGQEINSAGRDNSKALRSACRCVNRVKINTFSQHREVHPYS